MLLKENYDMGESDVTSRVPRVAIVIRGMFCVIRVAKTIFIDDYKL